MRKDYFNWSLCLVTSVANHVQWPSSKQIYNGPYDWWRMYQITWSLSNRWGPYAWWRMYQIAWSLFKQIWSLRFVMNVSNHMVLVQADFLCSCCSCCWNSSFCCWNSSFCCWNSSFCFFVVLAVSFCFFKNLFLSVSVDFHFLPFLSVSFCKSVHFFLFLSVSFPF